MTQYSRLTDASSLAQFPFDFHLTPQQFFFLSFSSALELEKRTKEVTVYCVQETQFARALSLCTISHPRFFVLMEKYPALEVFFLSSSLLQGAGWHYFRSLFSS
jgi:hypothetical protein